jgi:pre-mRNA-splicing helicase BRR2
MDVSALNLGMIAAYYNISCTFTSQYLYSRLTLESDVTVEVYTLSLKERTKLKGLLEVVSSSAEFETIPIRRHEDSLLRRIYDRVPVKLDRTDFEAPISRRSSFCKLISRAYSCLPISRQIKYLSLRKSLICSPLVLT